jgi:hypothetical protein
METNAGGWYSMNFINGIGERMDGVVRGSRQSGQSMLCEHLSFAANWNYLVVLKILLRVLGCKKSNKINKRLFAS